MGRKELRDWLNEERSENLDLAAFRRESRRDLSREVNKTRRQRLDIPKRLEQQDRSLPEFKRSEEKLERRTSALDFTYSSKVEEALAYRIKTSEKVTLRDIYLEDDAFNVSFSPKTLSGSLEKSRGRLMAREIVLEGFNDSSCPEREKQSGRGFLAWVLGL